MASSKNRKSADIKIDLDSKYPLIPLAAISIVERPTDGEEKLFFNPRGLSSFTPERMEQLQYSIRTDGLQQPPIVRLIVEKEKIVSVELIAGERRIRSLSAIYENDTPCFDDDAQKPHHFESGDVVLCRGRFGTVVRQQDEGVIVDFEEDCIGDKERKKCDYDDVFPTVSGRELYGSIPCKIIQNCSDQRALRLAFTENDQSEPLTIAEEIALVRRLEQMEMRQEEIAAILGSNVTWVSQTSNFEEQLPEKAFGKLIKGEMARHVAVHLLSYPAKDREALFDASIAVEEEETATKIRTLRREKERLEDEEELYLADAKKAEKIGDEKVAKRAKRKAESLATKAEKTAQRLKRAKEDRGVIKQGHVKKGAVAGGLQPRKAKILDKADIETTFIHGMAEFLDGTGVCDQTGETIPEDYAAIVHRTAAAIISGVRDPLQPIRDYMVELGRWEVADNVDEEIEDDLTDDIDGENFDEEADIEAYFDEDDEEFDE